MAGDQKMAAQERSSSVNLTSLGLSELQASQHWPKLPPLKVPRSRSNQVEYSHGIENKLMLATFAILEK